MVSTMKKISRVLTIGLSLLLITSCGSSFTQRDLEACDTAWDSTGDALLSLPRAAYSDTAPYPTDAEVTRHFQDLSVLADELVELANDVDGNEFGLSLMSLGSAVRVMASEFLVDPLSKGTPGITQFNKSLKEVRSMCEKSGWKN